MLRLSDIIDIVQSYNPQADFDLIKKAYVYSAKVHAGQVRKSGEPYLSHPLEVAKILAEMKLDDASICTGLLHDTIEDTLATHEDIETLFGKDIVNLVEGVTKLSQIKFQSTEEKQAENFRKMLVAISKDIRVLLVKLADRLHNMRTLQFVKPEKQESVAQETMEIYAPLANRLGIGWLKSELEDLSFKYLKPRDFVELKEKIGKTKKERTKFIEEVIKEIERALEKGGMSGFEVSGRPKHLWSIYRKMVDKGLQFEDIHDLIAFRLIVDNVGQCYEALGHIHAVWRPIPGRFKDYIAMPKPNNYRSLHTTLIGPRGERLEIQIRTREMNEVAELGIAAHWKYKEHGGPVQAADAADRGFAWLKQLMAWQKELKDPSEFLDSVKVDLFSDEVYVFTPKGSVIELPRGATPVDFAFAIHSDIGMQCVGAKVNNRLVPLRHPLENGDTCEIITQNGQKPKKDWLEFVKTSRARNKIRGVLRQVERQMSHDIGFELLEKDLRRYGVSLQKIAKSKELDELLKDLPYKKLDEICIAIGYGKLELRTVVERLVPKEAKPATDGAVQQNRSRLGELIERVTRRTSSGIRIEGVEDVLVHYARCCSPVKGDPIVGFVTRGRGLTIHRRNCAKVMELDPERRIHVFWDTTINLIRTIRIRVVTENREGMLADLSAVFTRMNMNILEANCKTFDDGQAVNTFKCGVVDVEQLKRVVKMLESVEGVHSVERVRSISE